MTLDHLKPGEGGTITVVGGQGALLQKTSGHGAYPKNKNSGSKGRSDGRSNRTFSFADMF